MRRYVLVVVEGRGSESGNVTLRVRYEGSCLTGYFKWCVGRVNGKLENGFRRRGTVRE